MLRLKSKKGYYLYTKRGHNSGTIEKRALNRNKTYGRKKRALIRPKKRALFRHKKGHYLGTRCSSINSGRFGLDRGVFSLIQGVLGRLEPKTPRFEPVLDQGPNRWFLEEFHSRKSDQTIVKKTDISRQFLEVSSSDRPAKSRDQVYFPTHTGIILTIMARKTKIL